MVDSSRDPRVLYAASVLLGHSGPEPFVWPDWLSYGDAGRDRPGVLIVPSGFFGEHYGSSRSLPRLPLRTIETIPLLFGEPCVEREGNVLVVQADILASAFFLLTRYEEWVRKDVRDVHGRFPGKESLAYRAGFIDRPIVEEYAAMLYGWVEAVGVRPPRASRHFSVLLTHDVDSMGTRFRALEPWRSLLGAALGRQPWRQALQTTGIAAKWRDDPRDNMEDLIHYDRRLIERAGGQRCNVLYFLLACHGARRDANYDLHSAKVRRLLRLIRASGAEVGIHASYGAGDDPRRLAGERAMLEETLQAPVTKNRHHILRWQEPGDGAAIAAAGIAWDSSLGYADVAGFRLGVCRPVSLFDPAAQRPMGIEEHPLIVMDCTLSEDRYMGLDEEAAFACVRRLADTTMRHQGEFVILWHNTVLSKTASSYHRRLYPRILDYLASLFAEPNERREH